MLSFRSIALTDRVNKYKEKFSVDGLVRAYEKSWNEEFPVSVNHDHTKCIGKGFWGGIYVEPGTVYQTSEIQLPENDDERDNLIDHLLFWEEQKKYTEKKDLYIKLEKMLDGVLSDIHKWLWADAVTIVDKDIVDRIFPEITSGLEDGLYPIKLLTPVLPGVYKKGDFLIFAHSYFRRNLSRLNSLNSELLSRLANINDAELDVKIALDFDMIGLYGTQCTSREYQYWWGPTFDDNLSNIQNGVSRYENEKYNELMSNIRQTEFSWYTQDERKTFECEEITDIPNIISGENEYYGCRFTHSMLDGESGLPYHLDGAIRAYTDEKMLTRLDVSLVQTERDTVYTKIWRIDNKMPIAMWKELITHWYRDNHLIGEYFGGIDQGANEDVVVKKDTSKDHKQSILAKYIPIDLKKKQGIRFSIQFQKKFIGSVKFDVTIKSNDYIMGSECHGKYYENEALTLIKIIKKNGANIRLPYMKRIAFDDTVMNFPIFRCESIQIAQIVQNSILELCQAWNQSKCDRLLSYSIQINLDDKSVMYSFAGNTFDIEKFILEIGTVLPNQSDISTWIKRISEISNLIFEESESIKMTELMKTDGTLYFDRKWIDEKYIKMISVEDKGLSMTLKLPYHDGTVIKNNGVNVASVYEIKSSQCSHCGKDYSQCDCIKYIDKNILEQYKEFKNIGFVGTIHHT
ncbi:hypothetical protein [Eubacterium limosum]|uniref:hypothetical protein n=1 Tax=Eubacterium limosum TaxID=1736 RepID=UPI003718A2B6